MKKSKMPESYVCWDLETSGLDSNNDKIIEIGAVKVKNGEVVETKSWLLNHGIFLSEKIIEITKITDELIDSDAILPEQAYSEFLKFFGDMEDWTNITHNGFGFDIKFLVNALPEKYAEEKKKIKDAMIDTAVFVKAMKLHMPQFENESFESWARRVMSVRAYGVKFNIPLCCEELEIDTSNATFHRAVGDALLTNLIYQKLCL